MEVTTKNLTIRSERYNQKVFTNDILSQVFRQYTGFFMLNNILHSCKSSFISYLYRNINQINIL
jgi:hypothetical protein